MERCIVKMTQFGWFRMAGLWWAVGVIAALSSSLAWAQRPAPRGQVTPPRTSAPGGETYKDRKTSPSKPRTGPLKAASQEDLANAIVGDTLDRLIWQSDHHYHEGEWEHTI